MHYWEGGGGVSRFALVLYARWCVECAIRGSYTYGSGGEVVSGATRKGAPCVVSVPGVTEPVFLSHDKADAFMHEACSITPLHYYYTLS